MTESVGKGKTAKLRAAGREETRTEAENPM
jgi:hypothetical protein